MLTINGHDYHLKMTFKALKAFGIVTDDFENNTEQIGNLMMGILGGDIVTLKNALVAMTDKSNEQVQEDLEKADSLEEVFVAIENLLLDSPLTKKMAKMIHQPLKEGLIQAEQKMKMKFQEATSAQ